jgi:hypothetical protein
LGWPQNPSQGMVFARLQEMAPEGIAARLRAESTEAEPIRKPAVSRYQPSAEGQDPPWCEPQSPRTVSQKTARDASADLLPIISQGDGGAGAIDRPGERLYASALPPDFYTVRMSLLKRHNVITCRNPRFSRTRDITWHHMCRLQKHKKSRRRQFVIYVASGWEPSGEA